MKTEWPEVVIALGQEIQRLRREIAELKRAYALDVGEELLTLEGKGEKYVN